MTLTALLQLLKDIVKCHPEAGNADVWAVNGKNKTHPVSYVGYDKRHKPARIKLEE